MECVASLRKRLVGSSAILDETSEEEKKTDDALTELAKAAVNQQARQAAE